MRRQLARWPVKRVTRRQCKHRRSVFVVMQRWPSWTRSEQLSWNEASVISLWTALAEAEPCCHVAALSSSCAGIHIFSLFKLVQLREHHVPCAINNRLHFAAAHRTMCVGRGERGGLTPGFWKFQQKRLFSWFRMGKKQISLLLAHRKSLEKSPSAPPPGRKPSRVQENK